MNTLRTRAFTLIELIVVIIILLILISLISIGLKASLQKAKQTQCLSHLKALHQATLLFVTDEDRRREISGNNDPDFPTTDEFSKMPSSPAEFRRSILTTYAGSTFEKLKCPVAPATVFGYKINENLMNGAKRAEDKNGKQLPFEELKNNNVLIFEVDSGGSRDTRHNGFCYGVTLYGELILNVVDTDAAGAAYDLATPASQRVSWASRENKNP